MAHWKLNPESGAEAQGMALSLNRLEEKTTVGHKEEKTKRNYDLWMTSIDSGFPGHREEDWCLGSIMEEDYPKGEIEVMS